MSSHPAHRPVARMCTQPVAVSLEVCDKPDVRQPISAQIASHLHGDAR